MRATIYIREWRRALAWGALYFAPQRISDLLCHYEWYTRWLEPRTPVKP